MWHTSPTTAPEAGSIIGLGQPGKAHWLPPTANSRFRVGIDGAAKSHFSSALTVPSRDNTRMGGGSGDRKDTVHVFSPYLDPGRPSEPMMKPYPGTIDVWQVPDDVG